MSQMGSIPPLARKGFAALCLTLFAVAYNFSVIPPIMPPIVRELDSSVGYIQGTLVLFSLVTASFAPTTENLCRFYGRSRIFITGLLLYGCGIALTSFSPTIEFFVVSFSLLTGLAATPLISTPWAIANLAYESKAKEQTTLVMILASTTGGLSGILLGGWIASNIGWRWAFAPSLAVLLLIWGCKHHLPNLPVRQTGAIDWVGGLLSFLGLGSILLGISFAGEYGWWTPKQTVRFAGVVIPPFAISIVPTLIAVGVICLGFFSFWQRRQANQGGASLLRVGLLRNRVFVFGVLTAMLHTLITTGVQFNLYQFVPTVLALNPFQTALTVLPYTLTMIVTLITLLKNLTIEEQFPPKYVIYSGITLLGAGIWQLYAAVDQQVSSLELMPGLILMGIGSGLFLAYIGAITYSVASPEEKPESSGIYHPVQNLGSSLGRGILGTTLITFTSEKIVDGIVPALGKTLSFSQRQEAIATLQRMIQTYPKDEVREVFAKLPTAIQPSLKSIVVTAASEGMQMSLLVALLMTIGCLLLATALPPYPLRR